MIDELFHRGRMPTILQSEASECGLACLAIVASRHGRLLILRNAFVTMHPKNIQFSTI
ncbi:MAG TPA: hypothetical protein DF715_08985 [Oceanicaulis sp.]|nr:hypothetical protein [Oceanicaulis sp.]